MSVYFDTKDPAEAVPLTFDFTLDLATGETLTGTPTVTVTTFSGVDLTPADILNGSPTLDTTSMKVLVPVIAGNIGCVYQFVVECATTNAYKTLVFVALLPVNR